MLRNLREVAVLDVQEDVQNMRGWSGNIRDDIEKVVEILELSTREDEKKFF